MAYKNKEKERQNKKEYYRKNREKILENKKRYYQKNKEKINKRAQLYGKKWYQKNKKKVQMQHRKWYQINKEKRRQYHKKYNQENKERVSQKSKKYYQKNREKIRLRHKKYNLKNKQKLLEYKGEWQKIQRRINPRWRLDENMGRAIWASIKNKKAGKEWEHFVEYNLDQLIEHLEKKFDGKMNWDNYGNYWAIDHIKPKSLFTYNSEKDTEFKQCWALENLQPLEKIQNIKKGNRYIG